jgi:hypothetical protein
MDVVLRKGAHAHGFNTDLWTLPRVAIVIERVTGVHCHPFHVWKLLGAMNWALQRPAKQAKERNPDAVKYWEQQRWPGVKNARRRNAWIFFQDESGVSQPPSIRRTWAPRGETPVLIHAFSWDTLSSGTAIGYGRNVPAGYSGRSNQALTTHCKGVQIMAKSQRTSRAAVPKTEKSRPGNTPADRIVSETYTNLNRFTKVMEGFDTLCMHG